MSNTTKVKYPMNLTRHLKFDIGHWIFIEGGVFMVFVKRMPGDNDDTLIKKFIRKVIDDGIITEAKRRQFYLKPSLAKKMKQEEARRNRKKVF